METAIDFSIIPNDLIRSLRKFNLTANQLELLLFIKSLSFRNSKELVLTDKLRNKILDFFELNNWEHASKILNQLSKKGLILIERFKCSIKVIFSDIFKLRRSQTILAIDKTIERVSGEPCRNNILNKVLTVEKSEADNKFIPSYIPELPADERKNFSELIKDHIRPIGNPKGINTYPEQQPTLISDLCNAESAIQINNQYVKALKAQMLKYGYSNQDVDTAVSFIFKGKNKNIKQDRINDLAKAIIYNRIDKSPKRKPINDLRAFIISSLFSKEEKFIFHKLNHVTDFPYSEIKTELDIRQEQEKKRAAELQQVQQEEQQRRSQEQEQFETIENALKDKLKDKYEVEFSKVKTNIIKKTNNQFIPWPAVISSLYEIVFNNDTTEKSSIT